MKNLTIALISASLLSGCCMFFPCHAGLWTYGRVTLAGTDTPIAGARVSVFGTTVHTGADGCFKLRLADALPFTFTVTSAGYKAAVSTPPRGVFRTDVELVAQGGADPSTVTWTKSSEQGFAAASCV